jgi:hypothetical protein
MPPAPLDPRYVEARRVLLDALFALAPHGAAVIVAGAQAIYLHTGDADFAIAPFTTDSDFAINPSLLGDDPQLEAAMQGCRWPSKEPTAAWSYSARCSTSAGSPRHNRCPAGARIPPPLGVVRASISDSPTAPRGRCAAPKSAMSPMGSRL